MTIEQEPAPLRSIDTEQLRKDMEALEARQAVIMQTGQKLLARLRASSKYHHQVKDGELFHVCIGPAGSYCVQAEFGQQYRLQDVDLFAVFDEQREPTQITFENHDLRQPAPAAL